MEPKDRARAIRLAVVAFVTARIIGFDRKDVQSEIWGEEGLYPSLAEIDDVLLKLCVVGQIVECGDYSPRRYRYLPTLEHSPEEGIYYFQVGDLTS